MWCPKCQTEYITGITVCKECGSLLVNSLESAPSFLQADTEIPNEPSFFEGEEPLTSSVFLESKSRLSDVKTTAYTFTFTGLAGMALIFLSIAGILPFQIADSMKWMVGTVMFSLFLVFLAVGIRYFFQLKQLKEQTVLEEETTKNIHDWFFHSFTADCINRRAENSQLSPEQLYFFRYEIMKELILSEFPSLSEGYTDYLIELFYPELFSC